MSGDGGQEAGVDQLGHDIPLCQAIGEIEGNAGVETTVGDYLCEAEGLPKNLSLGEWMEFVEAVHTYVGTYRGVRFCDECHESLEEVDVEAPGDILECPECSRWTYRGFDELFEPATTCDRELVTGGGQDEAAVAQEWYVWVARYDGSGRHDHLVFGDSASLSDHAPAIAGGSADVEGLGTFAEFEANRWDVNLQLPEKLSAPAELTNGVGQERFWTAVYGGSRE